MQKNNAPTADNRLSAYAAMSLALAAVSSPVAANAAAVKYDTNATASVGNPVFFNAATGSIDLTSMPGDYEIFTQVDGLRTTARFLGVGNPFAVAPASSNGLPEKLALSNAIGAGLYFLQGFSTLASNGFLTPQAGNWNFPSSPADVEGYVGLHLTQGGHNNYGWADLVVHSDYTVTLRAIGYETTPGTTIAAGAGVDTAAPEPSSILLLALGAAGIAGYRRKNQLS